MATENFTDNSDLLLLLVGLCMSGAIIAFVRLGWEGEEESSARECDIVSLLRIMQEAFLDKSLAIVEWDAVGLVCTLRGWNAAVGQPWIWGISEGAIIPHNGDSVPEVLRELLGLGQVYFETRGLGYDALDRLSEVLSGLRSFKVDVDFDRGRGSIRNLDATLQLVDDVA